MNKLTRLISPLLLYACCLSVGHAAATVADGQPPIIPVSGECVMIGDQTYVLMTVNDFAAFTNQMQVMMSLARKSWNVQHATESGRVAWHGRKVSTTFATNRAERITEYADGYRHVERAEIRKPSPPPQLPKRKPDPFAKPKRLREMEARKAVIK